MAGSTLNEAAAGASETPQRGAGAARGAQPAGGGSLAERAGETVEKLARGVAQAAGDQAEAAIEAAREAKASAVESLEDFTVTARERIDEAAQSLSETVARNPLRSIAIAAGVGLLVGLLTRPERD
ncbi:glycine zipper domain-containing protein [Prosthecomicrobium sp. N25]|uniref:glycine zipper domain-containing protein n=1 Tax=Prosthecomicrobium sp. N25 TaxID=3129254 RepID=UPI003077F084